MVFRGKPHKFIKGESDVIVSPLLCDTELPRDHIEHQLKSVFGSIGELVIVDVLQDGGGSDTEKPDTA